jgi:hypothetical protein
LCINFLFIRQLGAARERLIIFRILPVFCWFPKWSQPQVAGTDSEGVLQPLKMVSLSAQLLSCFPPHTSTSPAHRLRPRKSTNR